MAVPERCACGVHGSNGFHLLDCPDHPVVAPHVRAARVANIAPDTLKRYLPANYVFVSEGPDGALFAGRDVAGWTLDDYVIPRLASGLHFAREVELDDAERAAAERALAEDQS